MICPACQSEMLSRHDERVGCEVYKCSKCNVLMLEGSLVQVQIGSGALEMLQRLKRLIDDEARRHKELMESSIDDPRWTKLSV